MSAGRAGTTTVSSDGGAKWRSALDRGLLIAITRQPAPSAAGVEPRAGITTEDFLAIPHLVRGTDRIGLVPGRVATLSRDLPGLVTATLPFELGILVESLWWHPSRTADPGHRWLQQLIRDAAATLGELGAVEEERPGTPR